MRRAMPLMSPPAPVLAAFFAALRLTAAPQPAPTPARPAALTLPLRVQVALQAAARARR